LLKVLFFVHYTINQFRRHGWVQDFLKGAVGGQKLSRGAVCTLRRSGKTGPPKQQLV